MAHLEAFIFGLYSAFHHALAEIAHHGHGVLEHLIAEIAGATVESGHFRIKLGGLEPFFGGHADGATCRGYQYHIGARCLYRIHAFFETLLALCGRAVVFTDMHMHDRRSGVDGTLCLAHKFLYRIRYGRVLLFCHFGSADGSRDYQLIHGS